MWMQVRKNRLALQKHTKETVAQVWISIRLVHSFHLFFFIFIISNCQEQKIDAIRVSHHLDNSDARWPHLLHIQPRWPPTAIQSGTFWGKHNVTWFLWSSTREHNSVSVVSSSIQKQHGSECDDATSRWRICDKVKSKKENQSGLCRKHFFFFSKKEQNR